MIPPPPIARRFFRRREGFTLIELLVVVAIIGILAAIMIPILGRVRSSADSTQCLSQLSQIGTALGGYMNDHDSLLPGPLSVIQGPTYGPGTVGSLAQFLEPYLPPSKPSATAGTSRYSPMFECPAAARKLNDPTRPTYFMDMILSPDSNQSVWGDLDTGQQPLGKAGFVNWSLADDDGHPLGLSELWAMQDADQNYVAQHQKNFVKLPDASALLPLPAHETYYNALFFDFHVAPRVAGITITETVTPPSSPAPNSSGSSGSSSSSSPP